MMKVIMRWQRQEEDREGSWHISEYARNCTSEEAQKGLDEAVELCSQHLAAGYVWEVYIEKIWT